MIAFFLGAGYSSLGGVPLAGGLFEERPEVDRIIRKRLVDRVLDLWAAWHERQGGGPEEYLGYLQRRGGPEWADAVWYVSLVIALKMGHLESVGGRTVITRHNLNRASGVQSHETLWSRVFRKTQDVSVLTTNYDILAERALRNVPRPRVPRPGFHYGNGAERLLGGGYPSYAHIQAVDAAGKVPLLKLHGSVSWSIHDGVLKKFHDCRPAVRGDAAIVAPVANKEVPPYLQPTWNRARELLTSASSWIFIGYSLPEYDHQVRGLLRSSSRHLPLVHVFDRDPAAPHRYRDALRAEVIGHRGIPEALGEFEEAVGQGGT